MYPAQTHAGYFVIDLQLVLLASLLALSLSAGILAIFASNFRQDWKKLLCVWPFLMLGILAVVAFALDSFFDRPILSIESFFYLKK